MINLNEYKNRFYNLMESTMGNVKPLINEGDGEGGPKFSLNKTTVNRTPGSEETESADLSLEDGRFSYDLSHKVEWRCKKSEDNNGQIVEILSNPPATFNYTAEGVDRNGNKPTVFSKKNLSIQSSVVYDRLKKENLLRHCKSKGYK